MPASTADCRVARLSLRSAGPYIPDMPMQPRPTVETIGPDLPSGTCFMAGTPTTGGRCKRVQVLCGSPSRTSPWNALEPHDEQCTTAAGRTDRDGARQIGFARPAGTDLARL